ncbi:META domain-containing protein [Guyparkeria hydrothermalis]|uniref:META domain-containing protein n=1 Tax=Guyparkeria hydrothermalis TaxID=923 RepID=UPI002020A2DB|nr:META domain-containing protein [Guyparkeria hydrothermalis]MCL7744215.1 META domain-containing protein [Guyparkeria hydrothermalis]
MKPGISSSLLPRLAIALLGLAAAPLLFAASTPPADSHWRLSNIATLPTIDPSLTDLMVDAEGNLSGVAGCNHYRQARQEDGYGEISTTRKQCSAEKMRQEKAFLNALRQTEEWQMDGERLLLKDGSSRTLAMMLEPIIPTYHFDCQGERVVFDVIRRGEIHLTHGDTTVMMTRTDSASGSHYEDESGQIIFSGKGTKGQFTRDETTLDCRQIPGPIED